MKSLEEYLKLYAITDRKWAVKKSFLEQVEEVLWGGATILQLREKHLLFDDFLKEAKEVKKLCQKYGVPLIINDNLAIAQEVKAEGIHVGSNDESVSALRKKTGNGFIIGATAKNLAQATKAAQEGASYLGVGAVYPSSTKKEALPVTKEELLAICKGVSLPVVAIGGLQKEHIAELSPLGIKGCAFVSALFGSHSIAEETKEIKALLDRFIV